MPMEQARRITISLKRWRRRLFLATMPINFDELNEINDRTFAQGQQAVWKQSLQ